MENATIERNSFFIFSMEAYAMEKTRVLVLWEDMTEERKRVLESLAPEAEFIYATRRDADKETVQSAKIILGNPSQDKVAGSPNLRFLQLASAGAESYVKDGILNNDVLLCNGTGTYGVPISEYMVGAALAMFKNFPVYRDQQTEEEWQRVRERSNKLVSGSVAVSVGAGDIGGEFLKRMKALGCTTIGIRRTMGTKPAFVDEQYTVNDLDSVLPRADIVALSLPQTPDTIGLFDAKRLALLKEDSVLINVGRGTAIVTEALCSELEKGRIRGAVLDVTDPEPLPKGHPLWKCKNVFITPHESATNSEYTREKSFEICCENFKAYLQGREPQSRVDKATGYRISVQ
jgi:phosphoglycerate dehydrogenase-like enzyme